jgi:hypothetical protein
MEFILQAIAKESSDPLILFLLGLIVADEQRHQELTNLMIAKLKDELAWTRSEGLARRVYEKGREAHTAALLRRAFS